MHTLIESDSGDFDRYWTRLITCEPVKNPLYAQPQLSASWSCRNFENHSFVVVSDDEAVIGCGLTLNVDELGRRCLGYFGMEASSLINPQSLSRSGGHIDAEAVSLFQSHFRQLLEVLCPDKLEFFDPVACGLMSPLTHILIEHGGVPKVYMSQCIELAYHETQLWQSLSRSCREWIEQGQGRLQFEFISGRDLDEQPVQTPALQSMQERRRQGALSELSQAQWQTGRSLVRSGNGFLVQAHEPGQQTLSALFVHYGNSCHYVIDDSVLVPGRESQLASMIWQAMLRSRQLGCSDFELDGRLTYCAAQNRDQDCTGFRPEEFGGRAQTRMHVSVEQKLDSRAYPREVA